jgi:hypothetical protein
VRRRRRWRRRQRRQRNGCNAKITRKQGLPISVTFHPHQLDVPRTKCKVRHQRPFD